jgi:alanine racemase
MSAPFVTINLEAVKHNILRLKSVLPKKAILAMVKADAYGHGLVEVSKTLENYVDVLGVARIDEAVTLRNHGITKSILLMSGVFTQEDMDLACRLNADLVLHQMEHLDLLKSLDPKNSPKLWIKVDSSMHRLGYPLRQVDEVVSRLTEMGLEPFVFMTHLPAVANDDLDAIKRDVEPFLDTVKKYNKPLSISNSAGITEHLDYMLEHNDIFRPGRVLYGLSPTTRASAQALGFRPVMSFFGNVIAKHSLGAGETIGYERAYRTTEPENIAIINVGYADGYPKTTLGFVQCKDFLCPIRGWVSMDMMAISIPKGCVVQLGDTVQMWGEGMQMESLCKLMNRTITDIIIPLASRVKRIYFPFTNKS